MLIVIDKLIKQIEKTIGEYEKTISKGNLPKEELAIQRDLLRGLKVDVIKRREQYRRASQNLSIYRVIEKSKNL